MQKIRRYRNHIKFGYDDEEEGDLYGKLCRDPLTRSLMDSDDGC